MLATDNTPQYYNVFANLFSTILCISTPFFHLITTLIALVSMKIGLVREIRDKLVLPLFHRRSFNNYIATVFQYQNQV